jgi:CMP-N,N'-diacetyllegionaminic acid synthase
VTDGLRVIGVVPARAGSERLPNKNMRPMAGRPMLAWTLEAAKTASSLDALVVSSDDAAVLEEAERAGVRTVRRPPALAGRDAQVSDAVLHALEVVGGRWDLVVLLQPTSPLRLPDDIDGAVRLCRYPAAPAVVAVSPLPKPAGFHGRLTSEGAFQRDPERFDGALVINGAVYVVRPEGLLAGTGFTPEGVLPFVMPADRGWDVDSLAEFAVCEALLKLRAEA